MKKTALILCLLLATLHARADMVVTLQIVMPRLAPQTLTIKTKGDKYRTDIARNISSISDLVTDDILLLNHAAKTYRKIFPGQIPAQDTASPQGTDPTAPKAPPKLKDTGRTEKVGNYNAEIYTAQNTRATYTYWVTKDYPDYIVISDVLKKIQARNAALNKTDIQTPDLSKLDGLVIKFETLSTVGSSITTTLLSAKVQPVDESEFQVPAGYAEISQHPQPAAAVPLAPAPAAKNP